MKIILTNPCFGKTTFLNTNKMYKGYPIYDNPTKGSGGHRRFAIPEKDGIVLVSIVTPGFVIDIAKHKYAAVLIDEKLLYRNYQSRRGKKRKVWRGWEEILCAYRQVEEFAKNNNVPCFDTFEAAADYLINT